MGKLLKEVKRAGKQAELLVSGSVDKIAAAFNRFALDDERKRAQIALNASELTLAEASQSIAAITAPLGEVQALFLSPHQKS